MIILGLKIKILKFLGIQPTYIGYIFSTVILNKVLLEHCSKCIETWFYDEVWENRILSGFLSDTPISPLRLSLLPFFGVRISHQMFTPDHHVTRSNSIFERRRWVHFYLNQETEIVITKKSKSSHNIGASRSQKRVNWLKTEKIWFRSKMPILSISSSKFNIKTWSESTDLTLFDLLTIIFRQRISDSKLFVWKCK